VFINSAKTKICHSQRSDSVVKQLSNTPQNLDSSFLSLGQNFIYKHALS